MAKRIGRPRDVEKRERFLAWWALPKENRVPKTIGEWCEQNETVYSTVTRWRDEPEFKAQLFKRRMEPAEESLTNIIKGLTDKAVLGEVQQAKLLFELLGEYRNVTEVIHSTGSGSEGYSPEVIEFMAEEMLEHEKMPDMPIDDLITVLSEILG